MNREAQEAANALIFSMDPEVLKGMMTGMTPEERTAIVRELKRMNAKTVALTALTKASSSALLTKASPSAPRTKASSGAADALHTALTKEMAETPHAMDKEALVAVSEQYSDAFVPCGNVVMMIRAVLRSLVDSKSHSDANALALAQHQNAEMKKLLREAKSQLQSAHETNRHLTHAVLELECLLFDDTDRDD